jgi:hypothetical protein
MQGIKSLLALFAPLTTSIPSTSAFTRASDGTFKDFEGNTILAVDNQVRCVGARVVTNLAASPINILVTQNITVVVDRIYQVQIGASSVIGSTAVISNAATGTLTGDAVDRQSFDTALTATTTTLTITITGDVTDLQVEDVTDQSNQNPSEYVSRGVLSAPWQGAGVDGIKYFDTLNGNTVVDDVVIEGVGADIPEIDLRGALIEPASTNYFLNSSVPVTQAAMVTAGAVTHTIKTTGDLVVTADATSVTVNVPYTWTTGTTADIQVVSGTGTLQVEPLPFATSYIETFSSTVTRFFDLLPLAVPVGLLDNDTSYAISLEFDTHYDVINANSNVFYFGITGDANNYINIAGLASSGKILTGGAQSGVFKSTQSLTQIPAGIHKILIKYDADLSELKMFLNGAQEGVALAGVGALNLPAATTICRVGSRTTDASQAGVPIKNVKIHIGLLTDAECVELTT